MFRSILQKIYYWKLFTKSPSIGNNIKLSNKGVFIHPEQITMGNNIFISEGFHISAYKLKIGSDVIIGPRLTIICNNHKSNIIGKTIYEVSNDKINQPVIIEDDVWIGSNVIILPGAKISQGCIIGAGSIVNKTLPPYTICVGAPSRPIKKRFSEDELFQHLKMIPYKNYTHTEIKKNWQINNIQ